MSVSSLFLCDISSFYELRENDPHNMLLSSKNNFQELKVLFKETKQEVHKAQLGWEKEIEGLGETRVSISGFECIQLSKLRICFANVEIVFCTRLFLAATCLVH